MKNLMNFLSFLLVIVLFASCDSFSNDADAEYAKVMLEQAQKAYDSLPAELAPLKGRIDSLTNFKQKGANITYDGEAVISDVECLYGKGDVLLVLDMGQPTILYKNSISHSIMKYDYSITGVKILDNVIWIKGWRTDHVIYIEQTLELNKLAQTYVYGY